MESHITLKMASLILICVAAIPVLSYTKKHGPRFTDNMTTTCEEFTQTARFNPYTMFNETWFVFYYWAPVTPILQFRFTPVTSKQYVVLHKHFEGNFTPPVNWTARHILMWQPREMVLVVENGDRGQFLMYSPDPENQEDKKAIDVRFKQTNDNKVVGMLYCEHDTLYVMSRVEDVPRQKDIQEVAARLNYRGRRGKSYLYQGHDWMPVPEQNEKQFWSQKKMRRFMYG